MAQNETHRNLLTGLLALNNGLITSGELIDALREWGKNRSKSVCDILQAAGRLDALSRRQVETQCADHIRRQGDNPVLWLAAVPVSDSLRSDLLQLADPEICLVFSATISNTQTMDPYATRPRTGSAASPAGTDRLLTRPGGSTATRTPGPEPRPGLAAPHSVERYRILRLHAKGGLGLVSIAEDGELRREVALKEIQSRHADNIISREAFLSEAEITARLEHPGVVPVYGLGQHADGRPYYAMRFIRGKSLRETIATHYAGAGTITRESSTRDDAAPNDSTRELEFRSLLGRFIAVCNTIEYAHSRRILHRDIKPANIMLGDYGETLVVDWGLAAGFAAELAPGFAAASDRADAATGRALRDANEARSGTAIGTPQYMSPEQATGQFQKLAPATDIYSLGATLYELLTGAVPFDPGHSDEFLRRVRAGQFVRPRERRPACPKALEAVCLKAMAFQPAGRYTSAKALARDLENWLADEPVLVYREPWSQRVRRWTRRHWAATQATVVAVLVIAASALIATHFINGARRREAAAKVEATRRSQQARELIDKLLLSFGGELQNYPGMQDARSRLLQLAADDYLKLTDPGSPDPELQAEAARAFAGLGDVRAVLNQFDEADKAYRSSEALWKECRRALPERRAFRIGFADCLTRRGILLAAHGRKADAEAAFQESLRELTPLAKSSPADADAADADAADALGTVLVNLGRSQSDAGRQAEAEESFRRAVSVLAAVDGGSGAPPRRRFASAAAMNALGRFLVARGREQDAIPIFRQAESAYRLLAGEFPGEAEYLAALAATRLHLAAAFRDFGNLDAEAGMYRESAQDYSTLLTAVPDVPRYRENLAVTRTNLGQALHFLGQNQAAHDVLQKSLTQLDDLASEFPAVPSYLEGAASARTTLASVSRELARFDDALALASRGVDDYLDLIKAFPDVPRYRAGLGVALSHRARIRVRLSALPDAEQDFQRAASELNAAIGAVPRDPHFRESLAAVLTQHAWLRRQTGDSTGCREFQQQALELFERLIADFPGTARFCDGMAWQLTTSPSKDLQDLRRAAGLAKRATALVPDNKFFWRTLGTVQYRMQEWESARASLRNADALPPAESGISACVQAMLEWQLGNRDAARSLLDEANSWSDVNRPGDDELSRFRDEAKALVFER